MRREQETMGNPDIERFWDRFIEHVRKKGITEHVARWDVRRTEQYIRTYPDTLLAQYGARHVEQYFRDIGREKTAGILAISAGY